MTTKTEFRIDRGWFEIIYRFPNSPLPRSLSELKAQDYMMVAEMPCGEFSYPMEAYSHVRDYWQDMGLTRPPQAYDIINMVCHGEGEKDFITVTLLLIEESDHKMMYPNALLDTVPKEKPGSLVGLAMRFKGRTYFNLPSFRRR